MAREILTRADRWYDDEYRTLRMLHDTWCSQRPCGYGIYCEVLLYAVFADAPEATDLMLGFPLGLS